MKRIAVLTSGGDAAGMNAAVVAEGARYNARALSSIFKSTKNVWGLSCA